MQKWQWLWIILLASWFNLAWAGTTCESIKVDPRVLSRASEQALALKQTLDRFKPKVALLARVGSDVSKYGMHYTHMAFVVKNYPGAEGQWTVIHLLNQCGTSQSNIYAQGLANFFMDDLFSLDYQLTLLKPALQTKLYALLTSPLKLSLHNNSYNMLAYPFSNEYQNSNQWVLEVITAANNASASREQVQEILTETGYVPTKIDIGGMSKFGAQFFRNNIKFDDHPQNEQSSGKYSVVSVNSVIAYLKLQGLLVSNQNYTDRP